MAVRDWMGQAIPATIRRPWGVFRDAADEGSAVLQQVLTKKTVADVSRLRAHIDSQGSFRACIEDLNEEEQRSFACASLLEATAYLRWLNHGPVGATPGSRGSLTLAEKGSFALGEFATGTSVEVAQAATLHALVAPGRRPRGEVGPGRAKRARGRHGACCMLGRGGRFQGQRARRAGARCGQPSAKAYRMRWVRWERMGGGETGNN